MLDVSEILKNVTATELAGVTYNGEPVPVFDDTAENNAGFPRIIIQDAIIGPQQGNRIAWRYEVTQVIKVTARYRMDVDSNIVNNISSQITQRLVPSTVPPYMSLGADFNILLAQVTTISNQRYGDPFNTFRYIDRNIRISYLIEQTANAAI